MQTTVLITGATSGIGRTTALHLARRGFAVFATGRDPAALTSLGQEASGLALTPLRLDVTDPRSLAEARAAVLQATGGAGLDAVINNAGYALAQPIEDVSPSQLLEQLATNTVGAHAVTRAFLPEMRRRRAGRVVFVGSIAGRIAIPLLGAYDVSKHALEALADAYRRELHAFGVRVILLRPGFIHSRLAAQTSARMASSVPAGSPYGPLYRAAGSLERIAERLGGSAEEVAATVEHALLARRPRAHYAMPRHARWLIPLFAALPTGPADALLRAATGFSARGLGLDDPASPREPETVG